MKLTVTNEVIAELSSLSPGLQTTASTGPSLLKIASRLPNVIPQEDLCKLDEEVKSYCVDDDITKMMGMMRAKISGWILILVKNFNFSQMVISGILSWIDE